MNRLIIFLMMISFHMNGLSCEEECMRRSDGLSVREAREKAKEIEKNLDEETLNKIGAIYEEAANGDCKNLEPPEEVTVISYIILKIDENGSNLFMWSTNVVFNTETEEMLEGEYKVMAKELTSCLASELMRKTFPKPKFQPFYTYADYIYKNL